MKDSIMHPLILSRSLSRFPTHKVYLGGPDPVITSAEVYLVDHFIYAQWI